MGIQTPTKALVKMGDAMFSLPSTPTAPFTVQTEPHASGSLARLSLAVVIYESVHPQIQPLGHFQRVTS